MKIPTVVIFSAAMLLLSAAAANGQARTDQKLSNTVEATFKSLDRNRDNELSKVEAKADNSIWAAFDTFDVNLNGYITKAEYMAHLERSTAPATAREPPSQHQQ
jgi:Ca2+-binding EF-hand superfamily protein